tara:strand:- start:827 stop:988 length:162 start_codon:yes stop_codon:yes gene_type:complete
VNSFGSDLQVSSQQGVGSNFSFTLRAKDPIIFKDDDDSDECLIRQKRQIEAKI